MAIKILITLEGAEDINKAFKGISESGEKMVSSLTGLNTAGAAGGKSPFEDIGVQFESAKPGIESTRHSLDGLREALHILRPVIRESGVAVGEIGGFARIAGAGILGLATAIGGTIIVALANLEEQSNKTKAGLTGLFGSKQLGADTFATLEKSAKQLGTSVESLAPAFESATQAFNAFQQTNQKFKFVALDPKDLPVGNIKQTADAVTNLFKIIRAAGKDSEEASKSAKLFFDALKEGGKVTPEVLNALPEGAIRLLGEALGKGAESVAQLRTEFALTPPTITKVIEALAKFGPQAQNAFDANAVKTFREELGRTVKEFTDQFRELTGISFSDFIIGEIKAVADGIRTSIEEFKRIRDSILGFLKTTAEGGAEARAAAQAEAEKLKGVQPFSLGAIFGTDQAKKNITDLGDEAKQAAKDGTFAWDAFGNSLKKITDDAVRDGEQMLRTFAQLQQTSGPTNKFVSPPGTTAFGAQPAVSPEQQTAQTDKLVSPFQEADNQIRTIWIDLLDYISTSVNDVDISQVTQKLVQPFQQAFDGIAPIIDQMIQKIDQLIQKLNEFNSSNFSGFGGSALGAPFAGGGYVRGPGTSTSDSIPAWLSNEEFVQPANRVKQYGVAFMEAIRRGLLSTDAVRMLMGDMRGFNNGGMVMAMANRIPRFAEGGQVNVQAPTPITLVIDRNRFDLQATGDTVKALSRFAVSSQLSSAGRKPSWVR